jgi:nucleoid DNA-binding protein
MLTNKMFNDIAIALNTADVSQAKKSYYAVWRGIIKNLASHGIVYLPDVGRMKIGQKGPISTPMNNSMGRKTYPGFKVVKFLPDDKLKDYIKGDNF